MAFFIGDKSDIIDLCNLQIVKNSHVVEWLKEDHVKCLLQSENDKTLGQCLLRRNDFNALDLDDLRKSWNLNQIEVIASHRRKGIAKEMLDFLKRKQYVLIAHPCSHESIRLFLKAGFTIGVRKGHQATVTNASVGRGRNIALLMESFEDTTSKLQVHPKLWESS